MRLKQFSLACLSHFSYLVADNKTGIALVIDPQRDIDIYLEEAKAANLTIKYVVLTHCHADFASGHLELAQKTGATVCMGAKSEAKFPFEALFEGKLLEFGDIALKVIETPGHTPESICLIAYDKAVSNDKPVAIFTGDTLFLGDVGRPDLLTSKGHKSEDLASLLYDSLQNIKKLPDETIVYPAHGAGSSCGKNLSSDSSSTMAVQKMTNWALKTTSKDAFVDELISCQTSAPKYFAHTASYNQSNHELLENNLKSLFKPLSVGEFLDLARQAQVLDVRDANSFAECHLKGSINIGLSGKYANWCGTVLDPQRPILIIAAIGEEKEAFTRLGRIGFDNVLGFLNGGIEALEKNPKLVETTERLDCQKLKESLTKGSKTVLDVRTASEYNDFHIEGAIHIPLADLQERLDEIPRDKDLAVVCAGGYRSSIAASILRQNGYLRITDLIGGMGAYAKSKP